MFGPNQQQALERTLLHGFSLQALRASGGVASQALGAWLVLTGPFVLLMTIGLTAVLQRVPAVASAQRRSELRGGSRYHSRKNLALTEFLHCTTASRFGINEIGKKIN